MFKRIAILLFYICKNVIFILQNINSNSTLIPGFRHVFIKYSGLSLHSLSMKDIMIL